MVTMIFLEGSGFGSKSNFTYFVDSHGSVEELGLKKTKNC